MLALLQHAPSSKGMRIGSGEGSLGEVLQWATGFMVRAASQQTNLDQVTQFTASTDSSNIRANQDI